MPAPSRRTPNKGRATTTLALLCAAAALIAAAAPHAFAAAAAVSSPSEKKCDAILDDCAGLATDSEVLSLFSALFRFLWPDARASQTVTFRVDNTAPGGCKAVGAAQGFGTTCLYFPTDLVPSMLGALTCPEGYLLAAQAQCAGLIVNPAVISLAPLLGTGADGNSAACAVATTLLPGGASLPNGATVEARASITCTYDASAFFVQTVPAAARRFLGKARSAFGRRLSAPAADEASGPLAAMLARRAAVIDSSKTPLAANPVKAAGSSSSSSSSSNNKRP